MDTMLEVSALYYYTHWFDPNHPRPLASQLLHEIGTFVALVHVRRIALSSATLRDHPG